MQQRSFGKQMWRIFGPIVIKAVVAFVVEIIILTIYLMPHMPEIMATVTTQEEYFNKVLELEMGLLKYGTEIAAISALVTIPILAGMFLRDRKQEKMQMQALPQEQAEVLGVSDKKAPLWKYSMIFGISIPFALGLNNILMILNLPELSEAYQEAAETLYTPAFPVQIICLGMIIPIMEELIFRGLIFKRIRAEASMIRSIVCSAIFFGLYHGNAVQIVYGTLCGLLLAYLYEKFQSLKAPIFAHMIMNIVACTVTEMDGFRWMFEQPMRMGIITVICAAIASSMFVLIREKV